MSDFSRRPEEMLRELEVLRPLLPEQAVKNFQDAIAKYKAWRREALEDLLKVLEEDDDDESVRSWIDLCSSMRAEAPEFFGNALNNIQLDTEGAAAGYRWQLTLMANEAKFFEELAKANAAQVRDYLVTNRESLADYTRTLDDKWRVIVDNGNKLQSEEKKLHAEMLEATRRMVADFEIAERTTKEKMSYAATFPLLAVEKLGEMAANLAGLPDGMGEAAAEAARVAREKLEAWLAANRALEGRMANYTALVNAEKGGVLPLFRETRREVYEYWEKNKLDVARDWMSKFRSSLESEWLARCPTSGQQDDAKDFYAAAFTRIEKHLKAVEAIAREFEDKWTGVFKGALAPKTIDELVDNQTWRVNAEELVAIRTPEVITKILENLDGYYEESFVTPLKNLEDKARDLPDEAREQVRQAVELARKRVEESIRVRIKELQQQVGESLRWFEPSRIQLALDRGELENELD